MALDKSMVITMHEVEKVYESGPIQVRALDRVSLEITRGDYVAIMGPSGSGKSTLMNVIGCLDRPTSGSYRLDDNEVPTAIVGRRPDGVRVSIQLDDLKVSRRRKAELIDELTVAPEIDELDDDTEREK